MCCQFDMFDEMKDCKFNKMSFVIFLDENYQLKQTELIFC